MVKSTMTETVPSWRHRRIYRCSVVGSWCKWPTPLWSGDGVTDLSLSISSRSSDVPDVALSSSPDSMQRLYQTPRNHHTIAHSTAVFQCIEGWLPQIKLVMGSAPHKDVKTVAHNQLQSVGFRSWSRFLAVSLQVTWVINPAVGCH